MRFRELRTLLEEQVIPDYDGDIHPGPYDPDQPGEFIICTGYGGPGEDVEGVIDNVSWQIRVVGPQNDYDTSEDLAIQIDKFFLSWQSDYMFEGGPWLAGIQRSGGAPAPLVRDDADRTHFICNYIFSHALALAN